MRASRLAPAWTGRNSALPSPPATKTQLPWGHFITASSGTSRLSARVRSTRRTFTNWPGQKKASALAKRALSLMVPVAGSTLLSMKCTSPPPRVAPEAATVAVTSRRPAARASSTSGNRPSGREKTMWMGSIWFTTTRGVL